MKKNASCKYLPSYDFDGKMENSHLLYMEYNMTAADFTDSSAAAVLLFYDNIFLPFLF